MAQLMTLVLLIQVGIAWCYRLEGSVDRGSAYQDHALAHPQTEEHKAPCDVARAHEDEALADEQARVSPPDYPAMRQQIEWYLGDENLHHDKFFHDKISAQHDGWLEVKFILTCNRIKDMGASSENDILTALKGSNVEVKDSKGGAFIRRPGNAPLPKWEPKPRDQSQSLVPARNGGIISVFNNVTAAQPLSKIRGALETALPPEAKLWFISEVDDKQRCFCATAPFEGDAAFFKGLTLIVGGAQLKSEVCRGDLLAAGLKLLPKHILERREKETVNLLKGRNRPVIVGTQRLVNIGVLRNRAKEISIPQIDGDFSTPDGHDFNSGKEALRDSTKILERMHAVLYDQVLLASQAVEELKTSFNLAEVVRRVVRYIYNPAKRDALRSIRFEKACDQLVESAMRSYELTFGQKKWFFTLDLAPAFAAVAWELFKGQRGLTFANVQTRTKAAFEEYLESALLNKGIWEASSKTFGNTKIREKVYAALQRTHKLAFNAIIMEHGPERELEGAQKFLKRWIKDSMTRAWNSVPDPESVFTFSNVSRLFQNALTPFGPDDSFSTIPTVFTNVIGPPPRNWDFVNNEVKALLNSWGINMSLEQEQKLQEPLDLDILFGGMWEASNNTFLDAATQGKVYKALRNTYKPSLDATVAELRPGQDLEQVKEFFKQWINRSMTSASRSIPDAKGVLAISNVSRLFQKMISPFGAYDQFSIIPSVFAERIGPLPRNWSFINDEVQAFFNNLNTTQLMKAKKYVRTPVLKVGDSAILNVKWGKWQGNHTVKVLSKTKGGLLVRHDEDGYECVIHFGAIKSGKMAFVNALKNKDGTILTTSSGKPTVDLVVAEETHAEDVGEMPAEEKAVARKMLAEKHADEKVATTTPESAEEKSSAQNASAEKSADSEGAAQMKDAGGQLVAKKRAAKRASAHRAAADEKKVAEATVSEKEAISKNGKPAKENAAEEVSAVEVTTKRTAALSARRKAAAKRAAAKRAVAGKAVAEGAARTAFEGKAAVGKTSADRDVEQQDAIFASAADKRMEEKTVATTGGTETFSVDGSSVKKDRAQKAVLKHAVAENAVAGEAGVKPIEGKVSETKAVEREGATFTAFAEKPAKHNDAGEKAVVEKLAKGNRKKGAAKKARSVPL